MNNLKEIDIKIRMYYFLDDMISFKNLDLSKIRIVENSFKNFFIYYIGYMITTSVKPLYLIINKINGYSRENNGNKYLTLFPTDESKDTLKRYEELWSKSTFHTSRLHNLENYNEKYRKLNLFQMTIYL